MQSFRPGNVTPDKGLPPWQCNTVPGFSSPTCEPRPFLSISKAQRCVHTISQLTADYNVGKATRLVQCALPGN